MKNLVLALSLMTLLSGSAVFADTITTNDVVNTSATTVTTDQKPIVLDVPAHKTRKRLLFSFGLFGMGMRMGWMKPKGYENPETAHGIGYPILNVSAGHHAFGLGTK